MTTETYRHEDAAWDAIQADYIDQGHDDVTADEAASVYHDAAMEAGDDRAPETVEAEAERFGRYAAA